MKFSFFLLVIAAFLFQACEKESGKLGLQTLSDENTLTVLSDTSFSSIGQSNFDNSLYAASSMNIYLGTCVDPIFGRTTVDIATPLYATNLTANFSDASFSVSKAYLVIERDSIQPLGDASGVTYINAYVLNTNLDSSKYTTATTIETTRLTINENKGTRLGILQLKGNYNSQHKAQKYDSIEVDTSVVRNLVKNIKTFYKDSLAPDQFNKSLLEVFKGVYLRTNATDKAAIRKIKSIKMRFVYSTISSSGTWDLSNNTSFYDYTAKDEENGYIDSKVMPMQIVTHMYPSDFSTTLKQPNSGKLYVQALHGTRASFIMQSVGNLQERYGDHYMINSAKLSIPFDATDTVHFPPLEYLTFYIYLENGSVWSKSMTRPTVNHRKALYYEVELADYLLSSYALKKNTANFKYEILAPGSIDNMYRVVLNTGVDNCNLKLKVLYTKYK